MVFAATVKSWILNKIFKTPDFNSKTAKLKLDFVSFCIEIRIQLLSKLDRACQVHLGSETFFDQVTAGRVKSFIRINVDR